MARPSTPLGATWQKGEGAGLPSPCLKDGGVLGSRPRDLNFTSYKCQMVYILEAPEFPACGSFSPWDMSFVTKQPRWDKMGTGQNSPPPRPLSPSSAILPGMRHRKRCGKTLPHCSRASALISPEAAHLSDSPSVTMELWGWSCLPAPGAMGAFPSCPLPAASPSSCPPVKQIWAPAACLLGPRVHWPGSPKQEVHPEAQWPLWANWHLGQWGPGQRLHYLLQRGVREGRWSLLGR